MWVFEYSGSVYMSSQELSWYCIPLSCYNVYYDLGDSTSICSIPSAPTGLFWTSRESSRGKTTAQGEDTKDEVDGFVFAGTRTRQDYIQKEEKSKHG